MAAFLLRIHAFFMLLLNLNQTDVVQFLLFTP